VSTRLTSAYVTGSGVAGCLAAIGLRSRLPEVILARKDPGTSPGFLMTVTPAFAEHLGVLGLGTAWNGWPLKHELGIHLSGWGTGATSVSVSTFDPRGPRYLVDRTELEQFLLAQAALVGVEVVYPVEEPWPEPASGRLVIDATGRRALVARRSGGRRRSLSPLVALHAMLDEAGPAAGSAVIASVPNGWWFSARAGRKVSIFFITEPGTGHTRDWRNLWLESIPQTVCLRQRALAATPPGRPMLAGTSWLENPAGPGWYAVGEAAFALDPLSGGGLEFAAWTALRLLESFDRADGPAEYGRAVVRRVGVYRATRQRLYLNALHHHQSGFWQRQAAL